MAPRLGAGTRSLLELATLPGVVGGELRGTIHTSFPPPRSGEIGLRLECVRRIRTRAGKKRRTLERTLWTEDARVAGASRIAPQAISGVRLKVGMSSGSASYWDLLLEREGTRPVRLHTAIADKREAEWVAQEIRRAIGEVRG